MPTGTFRFYEELNDFLPKHRKKVDFEAECSERKSIKDIIEEFGVPPTKVDLVLINGKSVDFNTIFQDGDRVSVYPVFEHLNIQNVTQLRRVPLRRIQFIADIHLKDIVKPMRMLGFDIDFNGSYTTQDIIEKSIREKRIILTKRKESLRFESVTHGMLIRPGTAVEQVKYVIDDLDIKDRINPFSRCLRCNDQLENRQTKQVMDRILPETKSIFEKYLLCKSCGKQDRRENTCQLNVDIIRL
ncbi:MAG: twitching motility protein PilT [Deltaproteobacteria bacterium]|nr:twitching motility protein PilT [Deltaproteobacteria bacterium]